ncbi:spore germination protein GerM [Actinoplanes lutulentus]|uniref:Sporulation and spore germination protein n=1 Tax=Actinoplanes lutulentus TaxID=1287878 RepID=A0A327ZBG8_9ACTN|nr:GerMN domain-containing protein [Actinoplanes lutulentus]MBB2941421.1 spore germination protein GerM [Actinoplanes lutulentus]RAK36912.1 sporulation and spore germination protein [Actinoplanes lutulentus]
MKKAALLLTLLLAGCGIPAQDEPHAVTLPRGDLNTATAGPAPGGEVAEVLCLVRDGRLVQAVRRVSSVPTTQRQLDDLTAGPTAAERGLGLSTSLSGTTLSVRNSNKSDGVTVEVAEAGARSDEVLAYAQIVCTLTARADVASVSFTRDGDPLRVPRADGSLTDQPLRGWDYRGLITS